MFGVLRFRHVNKTTQIRIEQRIGRGVKINGLACLDSVDSDREKPMSNVATQAKNDELRMPVIVEQADGKRIRHPLALPLNICPRIPLLR